MKFRELNVDAENIADLFYIDKQRENEIADVIRDSMQITLEECEANYKENQEEQILFSSNRLIELVLEHEKGPKTTYENYFTFMVIGRITQDYKHKTENPLNRLIDFLSK